MVNKSLHYMDAYRKGATGWLATFANKKYTSHRCLPASWLDQCIGEYKAAFGEEAEASMVNVETVQAYQSWPCLVRMTRRPERRGVMMMV